jgi:hypothetical protein
MPAKKGNLRDLLQFLNLPFREVSEGKELCLTCLWCGKKDHLYVEADKGYYFCHRCQESGANFESKVIEMLVEIASGHQEGQRFAAERGLYDEDLRRDLVAFRLGFYEPLGRYVIPVVQNDQIVNLAFRAAQNTQEPKYIKLPGRSSTYFLDMGQPRRTFLVEGELDALSLFRMLSLFQPPDEGARIIATSASTLPKDLQELAKGPITAVFDNDKAGDLARKKANKQGLQLAKVPDPFKDINEFLVQGTREQMMVWINELLALAPKAPSALELVPSGDQFVTQVRQERPWLIEQVWYSDGLGFIVGLPKSLKSTLAIAMAHSVANGKPFLGFATGEPKRVLMVQEEDADFIIRERLIGVSGGNLETLRNIFVRTPGTAGSSINLTDDQSIEHLRELIEALEPSLLILDPFANLALVDENHANEINSVLEVLRKIRNDYKLAIAVVHHMRKAVPEGGGSPGLRIRGSSAFWAKLECAIYLEAYDGFLNMTIESKTIPRSTHTLKYLGDCRFELLAPPKAEIARMVPKLLNEKLPWS